MYNTLLIVLLVAFVAVLPMWPYSRKWGSLPSMGIGIVAGALAIMLYMGKL